MMVTFQSMKRNRAAGVDEVTVDLIDAKEEIGMQWLYRIMKTIWGEVQK